MSETFLDKAYDLGDDADATTALYDAWAASYDAEVGENGYVTPARCAEALLRHTRDPDLPILDFGCGTGLSGLALKLAGFGTIDGMEPSPDMLAGAAEKGVYRNLIQITPGDPIKGPQGSYAAIAAIGVIGTGAAPVSVFDLIYQALAPTGLIVMSLNDHALADASYEGHLNEYIDTGALRLLEKEYGEHLPGINLKSNVYVFEKT